MFNSSYLWTCVLNKEPYNTLVTVVGFFHGIVRNKGKICQVYETSVSKKLVHTKQCLILLLEMNRASLCCQKQTMLLELSEEHISILTIIFMVLLETNIALLIKISQLYCLFIVRKSVLSSICFFEQLDFCVWVTWLKFQVTWLRFLPTWLGVRWLPGNLTSYLWGLSINKHKPCMNGYCVTF